MFLKWYSLMCYTIKIMIYDVGPIRILVNKADLKLANEKTPRLIFFSSVPVTHSFPSNIK